MSSSNNDTFKVPHQYQSLSDDELKNRIAAAKSKLGDELLILTHHYQRKEIIEFNDFLGDSFALARKAADQSRAKHIVFCGVRFMAEAVDILTGPDQNAYLSHPDASCPMADMAPNDLVYTAWKHIETELGSDAVIPLVYMNSTSVMKAFCGERDGFVCTSANADLAFKHIFEKGRKVFFFPDQHLGRNTANKLGIAREKVAVYDPHQANGGLTSGQIKNAEVILWRGNCPVHVGFHKDQLAELRIAKPGIRMVVHPECPEEIVDMADSVGSTSHIVKYVNESPAGSTIGVGTELTMVNRLNSLYPDKEIFSISGNECTICADMNKTTLADLCYTVENLEKAEIVKVPENIANYAKIALLRMLDIGR